MTMQLKIVELEGGAAIMLPPALLAALESSIGDNLYAATDGRGVSLTARDPAFTDKMEAAERIMCEDRDILHVLAQ